MAAGRVVEDGFLARCDICGTWQRVQPEPRQADTYFEFWQAVFVCCGKEQTAWFTIEKVDDDVH